MREWWSATLVLLRPYCEELASQHHDFHRYTVLHEGNGDWQDKGMANHCKAIREWKVKVLFLCKFLSIQRKTTQQPSSKKFREFDFLAFRPSTWARIKLSRLRGCLGWACPASSTFPSVLLPQTRFQLDRECLRLEEVQPPCTRDDKFSYACHK